MVTPQACAPLHPQLTLHITALLADDCPQLALHITALLADDIHQRLVTA